ncbi:MAG: hypothetical protein JHD16_05260 [Solirubrobacteraceae bacterium]|nr:hypothetical protein [Solirubrobacteraceae bacterium]
MNAHHPHQRPTFMARSISQLRQAADERHPLLLALLGVAALHLIGFGLLLAVVAPANLRLSSGEAFGVGLGLTAYTLGMRHAFDADHIAVIDNSTRKFLQEGQRPHATGFFFSAGHSTVVLLLAVLVAVGMRGLGDQVTNEDSTLHQITSVWGPTFAGTFLLIVGLINLAVLRSSIRLTRQARRDGLDPQALDQQLMGTGMLSRTTQRLSKRVNRPWQLYPLGFLFGLGFDTATEIALLVLAGGGAAAGLPVLAILALPILFAAGMTLLDTLNGAATTKAYDWALHKPARRLAYNTGVTGVSVLFALVIGSLSLLGVAVDQFDITSGPLAAIAAIDVAQMGYALLGIILVTWAAAVVWWQTSTRTTNSAGT